MTDQTYAKPIPQTVMPLSAKTEALIANAEPMTRELFNSLINDIVRAIATEKMHREATITAIRPPLEGKISEAMARMSAIENAMQLRPSDRKNLKAVIDALKIKGEWE